MRVYLVQHAEATSKDVNPDRPLTDRGRDDVRRVAAAAAKLNVSVANVYHSGKLRAQQTAEILADALSPTNDVRDRDGLGPVADVEPIAAELNEADEPVMLVGHLPFMPRLTGLLVAGDVETSVVNYHNGGIVCLVRGDEGWQVDWILTPEVARA